MKNFEFYDFHMLFLKSWLEEYINLSDYTNDQLYKLISTKSSEVDGVETIEDYFNKKVLVGKITNVRKHPDADRLKIFDVDFGDTREKVQIVSAAPNVEEGLIVPTAVDGAKLPGFTIEPRKMRGETSYGMCCGKSELLLETPFSSGLWELNETLDESDLGRSICEVFPNLFSTETIFDVDVLPDRIGLIGSHLGFSLELARILERPELLTDYTRTLLNSTNLQNRLLSVNNNTTKPTIKFTDDTNYTNIFSIFNLDLNPDNNPEYSYRLPHNLLKRLFLTETHLVGGPTDLSNYLLVDLGQPNHFFSQNKLVDENISVQTLTQQKAFSGLGNSKKIVLPVETKVLQDFYGEVLALPGIVGGEKTKIELDDSKIVLEIANFEGEEVAKNTFKTKNRTDSSKQFTGQINPARILLTIAKLQDILELTNPKYVLETNSIWLNSLKFHTKVHTLSDLANFVFSSAMQKSLEVELQFLAERLDGQSVEKWSEKLTQKLDLIGDYQNNHLILSPFYSRNLTKEALLNEIIRLVGFENLANQSLVLDINNPQEPNYEAEKGLRETMTKFGFDQVMSRIFVHETKLIAYLNQKIKNPEAEVNLENFTKDKLQVLKSHYPSETFIRDSLLSSLAKIMSQNIKAGIKEPKIFELNKVYTHSFNGLLERKVLAGLAVTDDAYLLTSVIKEIGKHTENNFTYTNLPETDFYGQLGNGIFYTGQSLDTRLVEINNFTKKQFDLPLNKHIFYIEVDLTEWNNNFDKYKHYTDSSAYPTASRSYSVSIKGQTSWGDIEKAARSLQIEDVKTRIQPIERLVKDGLEIANFTVDFYSYTRTLENEDIKNWENQFFTYLPELEVR